MKHGAREIDPPSGTEFKGRSNQTQKVRDLTSRTQSARTLYHDQYY